MTRNDERCLPLSRLSLKRFKTPSAWNMRFQLRPLPYLIVSRSFFIFFFFLIVFLFFGRLFASVYVCMCLFLFILLFVLCFVPYRVSFPAHCSRIKETNSAWELDKGKSVSNFVRQCPLTRQRTSIVDEISRTSFEDTNSSSFSTL